MIVTVCCESKPAADPIANSEGLRLCLSAPADENWEAAFVRATIFIYPHDQTGSVTAPVVKYIFSKNDIEQGTALIPMSPDFLVGQQVDIFAVVNSRDTNIYKTNKPYSRGELQRLMDSSAVSRYNNSSYSHLSESIMASGGFMMAGSTSATIQSDGMQPIAIKLSRTVARIDLSVVTDHSAFRRYVTDIGEPNATLQITSAWMLRTNRRATVFVNRPELVDDYLAPYNRKDSLVQDNDGLLPVLYVGEFRFYTFETAERGVITYPFTNDQGNEAIKIVIRAVYDPDGNVATANSRAIYFVVPFQASVDPRFASAIVRNVQYKVNLTVVGIGGAIAAGEFTKARDEGSAEEINYVVGLRR